MLINFTNQFLVNQGSRQTHGACQLTIGNVVNLVPAASQLQSVIFHNLVATYLHTQYTPHLITVSTWPNKLVRCDACMYLHCASIKVHYPHDPGPICNNVLNYILLYPLCHVCITCARYAIIRVTSCWGLSILCIVRRPWTLQTYFWPQESVLYLGSVVRLFRDR